jgi:apolipoprotein N-acyltransferase
MKLLKFIPLWLISGILYGLSWPIFEGINLSFLAWFAFVPLFVFLEKNKQFFFKSMIASFAAMLVFAFFSAIWIFNFPVSKLNIALGFFSGVFGFLYLFYSYTFYKKKLGLKKLYGFFHLFGCFGNGCIYP